MYKEVIGYRPTDAVIIAKNCSGSPDNNGSLKVRLSDEIKLCKLLSTSQVKQIQVLMVLNEDNVQH